MDPQPLRLFTLLFLSMCRLGCSQKLPGSQDLIAIAKILNLPYRPYFIPHLPLQSTPERAKLFGLPPLPDQQNDAISTSDVTEAPTVPSRTTLAPLLRLLTLPPITLPPPPKIDSYGINTIPELPPQHESIYAGMFAPDGSLIEKKNDTEKQIDVKQTETNFIYDEDESIRIGGPRGIRAATVRTHNDRIVHDDHDIYDDDKPSSDGEESKSMASFLRQSAPQVDDASKQPSEITNSSEVPSNLDALTSPPSFGLVSLNTDAAISNSSDTVQPKVRSTTLTRLPVFISSESDPSVRKRGKIVALEAASHEQQRNSLKSHVSALRVLPVRSTEHPSKNGTVVQLPVVGLGFRSRDLDRTTVRPAHDAPHAVTLDRQVDSKESADTLPMRVNFVPRAKNLPQQSARLTQQLNRTAADLRTLAQISRPLQPAVYSTEQPRAEVNSAPHADESVQLQHGEKPAPRALNRTTPQQRGNKPTREDRILTHLLRPIKVGREEVPHMNALPTARVSPQKPLAPRILPRPVVPPKQATAAKRQQQQQAVSWVRTEQPRVLATPASVVLQYVPVTQYYYQNAQYQQQQQQLPPRDPQDEAYLREVEDYDHFWEAEHARSASHARQLATAVPVTNQQLPYKQGSQDDASLQRARVAASQTSQFVVQPQQQQNQQQQIYQQRAYALQIYDGTNGGAAGLRDLNTNVQQPVPNAQPEPQNVVYLPTVVPRLYIPVSPVSVVYAAEQKQQQQREQQVQYGQQTAVQPATVPAQQPVLQNAAVTIRPDTLLHTFLGGIFGNQQ